MNNDVTLKSLYKDICELLSKQDVPDYEYDAKVLIEHFCGIRMMDFVLNPNKIIEENMVDDTLQAAYKRATRYPLQYIVGHQMFMGLDFKVNESVLIPRQDTEILVEYLLDKCGGKSVLDMCTGSGCIAISLCKMASAAKVSAVDISKDALRVARENASINAVDVEFIESDLFENVDTTRFDVIVSNPPYIPGDVVKTLMPEVKDYEPVLALEASDRGLYFYKKISKEAKKYLNEGGIIAYEIGCEQAKDVTDILVKNGYSDVVVLKDYAGLDRVVVAHV
jgi:release factor glutamine methyltransferase